MVIAAKNDDNTVTLSLNIGMKQSQRILPAIETVLNEIGLEAKELDYMALCAGPGTFTGLRLAYSALKAIELSFNVPVYGIPSLEVYAENFKSLSEQIISVIDAKKDQFFASIFRNGKEIFPAADTTAETILKNIDETIETYVCGPDAKIFSEQLLGLNKNLKLKYFESQPNATDSLFKLAERYIQEKKNPLADYDGPIYLRKSEAEIVLEKSSSKN